MIFNAFSSSLRVREMTTAKIGTLLRITGQVVRTHPVHPELVSGTFLCLDCQTVIKDVMQQFKYTQPSICRNPVCSNRARFMLDVNKSRFVDFQKVRIQETQAELPRGCIPRRYGCDTHLFITKYSTGELGYDRLNGTRKIGPSYAKSVVYI